MRKISREEFWAVVATHPDQAKVQEVLAVFDGRPAFAQGTTVSDIVAFLVGKVAPAFGWAATVNGCKRPQDVEAQNVQIAELSREMSGGSIEWFLDEDSEEKRKESKRRIMRINRSFAAKRSCHSTYTVFVCYCDERKN